MKKLVLSVIILISAPLFCSVNLSAQTISTNCNTVTIEFKTRTYTRQRDGYIRNNKVFTKATHKTVHQFDSRPYLCCTTNGVTESLNPTSDWTIIQVWNRNWDPQDTYRYWQIVPYQGTRSSYRCSTVEAMATMQQGTYYTAGPEFTYSDGSAANYNQSFTYLNQWNTDVKSSINTDNLYKLEKETSDTDEYTVYEAYTLEQSTFSAEDEFTLAQLRDIAVTKNASEWTVWKPVGYSETAYDNASHYTTVTIQDAKYRFVASGPEATLLLKYREITYDESNTIVILGKVKSVLIDHKQPETITSEYSLLPPQLPLPAPLKSGKTRIQLVSLELLCSGCANNSANGNSGNASGLAPAGSGIPSLEDGPAAAISLGQSQSGESDGIIVYQPGRAGENLLDLSNVSIAGGASTEIIPDQAGYAQQVKAGTALANRVQLDNFSFKYDFYYATNVGAKSNGVYQVSGAPYVSWKFENPDGTNAVNRMIITEVRGGMTVTNLYTWLPATQIWEARLGNNLSLQRVQRTATGNLETEIREICSPTDGIVLERKTDVYEIYSWGIGLKSRTLGDQSSSENYSYTSDGKIEKIIYPTGNWIRYEYDSLRRLQKAIRSYKDEPSTALESTVSVTAYDYTPISGTGDDGTIQKDSPRTITERLQNYIIGKTFHVYTSSQRETARAQWPSAGYSAASNLRTITTLYTSGYENGLPRTVTHPDGTKDVFFYSTNSNQKTTTSLMGEADLNNSTNILSGRKTIAIVGLAGEPVKTDVYDIASGILISSIGYTNYDAFNRATTVTNYLDKTFEGFSYDCCSLSTTTNREGTIISYVYDDLKRPTATIVNGIAQIQNLDAAGRTISNVRQGTNGSQIVLQGFAYDTAGNLLRETNAFNQTTFFSEGITSGHLFKTNIFPNTGTRIEEFALDGSLLRISGTAAAPLKYDYGVEYSNELDGNNSSQLYLPFQKEIRLIGTNETEWVKTYTDTAGRDFKSAFPAASSPFPYTKRFYNNKGQLVRQRDQDDVTTLYEYNNRGEQTVSVLDLNRNGSKDLSSDRITEITSFVTTSSLGTNVFRTETRKWITGSSGTLISTSDQSVDGLASWSMAHTGTQIITNFSTTTYASGGWSYVTNMSPEGATIVSRSQYGVLQDVTQRDASGTQIEQTTYGYDAHGRQSSVTDARNGTTFYTFDSADQPLTVATPFPGDGSPPQTTTYVYNFIGEVWKTIYPDSTVLTNEYFLSGPLKKAYGSRTSPMEYTYDDQGRMKTMKTWQNFAGDTGTATTTWNYEGYRGWLTNKTYQGSAGPSYTYTAAGRLATRLWARGITTTYTYNNAGELWTTTYSDSTPSVTTTYDRLGRVQNVTHNGTTTTMGYNDVGQRISESHSGGILGGRSVTAGFNYLQRTFGSVPSYITNSYSYDAASRLTNVTDGTFSVGYTYLANSPLVSQITFKQNSTVRMTTSKSYDFLNRLRSISSVPSASGQLPISYAYQYNSVNQRTRATLADGSYWVYKYDKLGQVVSGKRYWIDGTPVAGQQYEYAFDDIGNRTSTKAGGNESGTGLRATSYTPTLTNTYSARVNPSEIDVLGIANSAATVTVNSSSTYQKGDYFHKALGVNNSASAIWQSIAVQAVNGGSSSNQNGYIRVPKASESFTYDGDGNLTSDSIWSYNWDGENRLKEMNGTATNDASLKLVFDYDYMGRRNCKAVVQGGSTNLYLKFIYDGWNLLAEMNATNNNVVRTYLWGKDLSGSLQGAGGVGGLLAIKETSATAHFAAFDGNGNVMGLVDGASGTVSAQYEYDPFGEPIRVSGTMGETNPFRWSTKYTDDESGLVYYGYRYYNPSSGRWISRDPIGEAGGLMLYGFCNNNPVNGFDDHGLAANWHHLLPQAHEAYFRQVGLDIHGPAYGWILEADFHTGKGALHPKWNQAWKEFIDKNPTPDRNKILKHLEAMKKLSEFAPLLAKGSQAKLSYQAWKAAARKARREALEAALKKGGKKVAKRVPLLGLVFISEDIQAKGVVGGIANNMADQVPWIGWAKFGSECVWGDWIPDKE